MAPHGLNLFEPSIQPIQAGTVDCSLVSLNSSGRATKLVANHILCACGVWRCYMCVSDDIYKVKASNGRIPEMSLTRPLLSRLLRPCLRLLLPLPYTFPVVCLVSWQASLEACMIDSNHFSYMRCESPRSALISFLDFFWPRDRGTQIVFGFVREPSPVYYAMILLPCTCALDLW